jgi:hypothetical protein
MKKQLILSSVIFMMLSIIACKKGEQGDIGPAGVAGANGAKGATGDTGIADAKGMISSDWIAIRGTDWRANTTANSYFASATSSKLTADVISKGMLYAYMKTDNDPSVIVSLPYAEASSGYRIYALAGVSNGIPAVQFNQFVPTLFGGGSGFVIQASFRYVLVPAGARTSNIDWTNYEEVKKTLNWKD